MDNQPPLSGLDPADLLLQGVAEDTMLHDGPHAFQPPEVDELAPLFPQFEILGLIGKGGMGAVYKVRQKELDRIVALKILPPAIGESPAFAARFAREAKALAKLNHPGIVTLHEFGHREDLYYILMEFVDGVNLATLMHGDRISPREALAIVPQICDALQFAHDHGIVHRDIKPENILLDRLGRVKVADFGIAKVVAAACEDAPGGGDTPAPADATIAGNVMGTPQYMALEQIEHPADVDHRADIYALGVVFYQMLTGELPGKEMQVPSSKVRIDVRLDEIVMQALEKKPELRYQQASQFKTKVETVVPENGDAGVPRVSRFSRTAIVGACWAPLVALALFVWFASQVMGSPGGPMIFILLPFGLTASIGMTILGWVAVSQIRRAAGRLHGMWLAVFDGLLFPLLLMTGLIGWFWHWLFHDLIRAAIIAGETELSTLETMLVGNPTSFTVLATLVTSLIAGTLIVRGVWRKVKTSHSAVLDHVPSQKASAGWAIGIGCGVLALMAVTVAVGLVMFLWLMPYNKAKDTAFQARAELLAEQGKPAPTPPIGDVPPERRVALYDWKVLDAEGSLETGVVVQKDGRTCLKVENLSDKPMQARLLTIEKPPFEASRYELGGEIRYSDVQGQGYLETWNDFPEGRYFSRTLEASGPMGQLTGTSDWREFTLPFDRTGTKSAPTRIEVNLHLPGRGVVFLGPLELIEIAQDDAAGSSFAGIRASNDRVENVDSIEGKISFRELPAANRLEVRLVTPDDPQAVSAELRQKDGATIPLELSGNVIVWDRHVEDAGIQRTDERYEILITLTEVGAKRMAAATEGADGTMRLAVLVDGEVRMAPFVQSKLGGRFVISGLDGLEAGLGLVRDLVDWPDDSDFSAMKVWLEKIDQGKGGEAWAVASDYFRKNVTREKWEEMATSARQPLGEWVTRRLLSAKRLESPPGAPEGLYLVIEFDSSFKNKEDAKEVVTLTKDKDGRWRVCGYFIL